MELSLPLDQAPQADLIDDATRTAGGRMVVDVTNGRKGMGTFIESHRQYFFTCARFASQFAQASLERACNDLLLRINLSTLDACILEFVASEVLAGGMPFRQMMRFPLWQAWAIILECTNEGSVNSTMVFVLLTNLLAVAESSNDSDLRRGICRRKLSTFLEDAFKTNRSASSELISSVTTSNDSLCLIFKHSKIIL